MPEEKMNRWQKAEILLKPLGGLLTALVVALMGFFGSQLLENRQLLDAKTRLYAELMSKREEADSALRKDMFQAMIATFLDPKSNDMKQQVLALELLAYNFHDALDLAPLFKHISTEIPISQKEQSPALDRLKKVAVEVADKQIAILVEAGGKLDGTIDLDEVHATPQGVKVIEGTLEPRMKKASRQTGKGGERDFTVETLYADKSRKEVRIRLRVSKPNSSEVDIDQVFWLGFFDFPMIDNTRLSNGDRCAVVLHKFQENHAEITLVYFPGSRASLKEKPYYDEVIRNLLRSQMGA